MKREPETASTILDRLTAGKSDDELVRMSHVHWPWMAKLIAKLTQKHDALEIGCWKGETTVWLAECGFTWVTAVDTFMGSPEHKDARNLFSSFQETIAGFDGVLTMMGESRLILSQMIVDKIGFDFIYVDGSHDSRDVIIDATLGFHLLRPGGIMVFDDYIWPGHEDEFRTPRPAIEFFLAAYAREIKEEFRYGCQAAVQKL